MKYILTIFLSLCINFANAKNNVSEKPFYGTDFKINQVNGIETIINKFDSYENKEIVLQAKADKVCTSKGCWMTIQLKNKSVRVKFKDYGFFVPMSLEGKNIFVKGNLTREKLSIKDARHYLEDAGASKEEIAAVDKPTVV